MDQLDVPAGAVVAGVDGSARAARALELAAQDAQRRGAGLHVVHAFAWLTVAHGWEFAPEVEDMSVAERLVADAVDRVRAAHPGLTVTGQVVVDDPAVVLVEASQQTPLVAVGARGTGRAVGPLLGPVAQKVAAHAHGPVLVVRELAPDDGGPVAVGTDPSGDAPEVLEYAFGEAARRGTGLLAVLAVEPPAVPPGHDDRVLSLLQEATATTQERLRAELAAWESRYPGVPVEVVLPRQHPVEALLTAAERACVVVVGSRGRRGLRAVRLGSVARGVLHHAPAVVVVRVPPTARH